MRNAAGNAAIPLASVITLLAFWEMLVRGLAIPPYVLPAPSVIWQATIAAGPSVLYQTGSTLVTVMLGFGASVLVSVPLALLIASSRVISKAIYPVLVLTQSVPKVALAPILLISLGSGELPRVIVTFLVAFFPLVVSSVTGLLATPPELLEMARACRASRLQELLRIRLPFAIPFVLSGMKVAIALCVVGAVVAEFVGAESGLGYLIQTSMAFFKVPLAFGAMLILSALGIILFQLVDWFERLAFPWAERHTEVGGGG